MSAKCHKRTFKAAPLAYPFLRGSHLKKKPRWGRAGGFEFHRGEPVMGRETHHLHMVLTPSTRPWTHKGIR